MIAIAVLSAMVMIKAVDLDGELFAGFFVHGRQIAITQMTKAVGQLSAAVTDLAGSRAIRNGKAADTIGFCSKCGTAITYGNQFCTNCGAPVPKDMIEEAEAARQIEKEERIATTERASETENPPCVGAENTVELAHADTTSGVASSVQEQPDEQICPFCGEKLHQNAQFCMNCGNRVNP